MTGPEHYQEAERLLAELDTVEADDVGGVLAAATVRAEMVARAQAHAILALAAAEGTRGHIYANGPGGTDRTRADDLAWHQVAGAHSAATYPRTCDDCGALAEAAKAART